MSAIPIPSQPVHRATASMVLQSLQAQASERGRSTLALALAKDAPAAPVRSTTHDVFEALFIEGGIVELSALPGSGALTLGLWLLAEARKRALAAARPGFLCAVDPSRTLHAPAVASLLHGKGVALDQLVVLRPDTSRLLRTSVRALRSGAFAGILVDAGAEADVGSNTFVTGARRLALAAEESRGFGVILTSRRARRGLPLPVAARALVEGVDGELHVSFLRHRFGNLPRVIVPRG